MPARDRPIERVAHVVEKHSRLGIRNAHRGSHCEAHTAFAEREKVVNFDGSVPSVGDRTGHRLACHTVRGREGVDGVWRVISVDLCATMGRSLGRDPRADGVVQTTTRLAVDGIAERMLETRCVND